MSEEVCIRANIFGHVQGVGFRAWLEKEATTRDINGWARNRKDGTVEVVLCGTQAHVDEVVALCNKGPAAARVQAVHVSATEPPAAETKRKFRLLTE